MLIRLKSYHSFIAAMTILLLAGCSGTPGSGDGTPTPGDGTAFIGNAQSVAKYRDNLTTDEAYHLLRTASFGATPDQVTNAVSMGLEATVDDLLSIKALPSTLSALEASYGDDVTKRWMVRLIEGPNPLQEQMTLFWHDRFAASGRVLPEEFISLGKKHWEMLRRNSLGNYRTFLQELTLDPLMLIWLNGNESPKDNPNENYAREFWELFTLGRDVLYTENDIKESARAFTGISLVPVGTMDAQAMFDVANHNDSLKLIFPQRAAASNYDYLTLIDLTLAQSEAAEYVARNLFEHFVHRVPSESLINDLALGFIQSDFEIAPLVKRILMSDALFSTASRGNQIRSPVVHVVGVARTLDMRFFSEVSQGSQMDGLVRDLRIGGHQLLNPPGVEGWGEGTYWLEDQWVISRVRALGHPMEYGPNRTAFLPYHLLPDVSTWDQSESRRQIVESVATVFHLNLTEEEIVIYIDVLDQNGTLALHLEVPDERLIHVAEMIRLMAMDEHVIGR